jgi:hypothetical protein
MKTRENTHVRNRENITVHEATISERMAPAVLAVFGSAGIGIGLWSFAALAGGLVAGGGPVGLASGYVRAVTGL